MEQVREEAFEKFEQQELEKRIKVLEFDNAELVKNNEELRGRVKQLATKHSNSGYRPRRHNSK